ncbi:hypothetical protein [Streptomyces sp. NBC_00158]|uniref:hypothetical protein n=1 Tax=Streptomyces sp. NBC_00158 TaxID=2903627 RepID=UPI0032536927
METHDENTAGERTPLTTEDLARPGGAGGLGPPVYPGEASGDAAGTTPVGAEDGALAEGPDGSAVPAEPDTGDGQPLLAAGDAERYRTQWAEIQGRFVDDPKDAVTSADGLVAEVMQDLAGTFAEHKQDLEGQWRRGDRVPTEELRMALQHYRSFFNRLLKT